MTTSNKLINCSNLNNFSNRENIGVTGNNDFLGTFGNSLEAWPQPMLIETPVSEIKYYFK